MILKAILTCLLIAATVNLATAILSDPTCTENGVLLPSAINCRNNFTEKACGKPVMVAGSSEERSKFCLRQSLVGKLFCRRSCGYCCLEVQSTTTTTTTLAPTTTATQTTEQITSTSAPTSTATSVAPSTTIASTTELSTTTTTVIPSTTSTAVPTTTTVTTVMPTTQRVPAPTARTGDPYACSDASVFDCSVIKLMCHINDSSRLYLVTHCPKTCGLCNEIGAGEFWRYNSKTTTTTQAPVDPRYACSNKASYCDGYALSLCTNSPETRRLSIMRCPKSCGYCLEPGAGQEDWVPPPAPTAAPPIPQPAPAPVAPPVPPPVAPQVYYPPVRACVDRVNPANGISDCQRMQYLCNDRTYFDLMTQQCPLTCQRCPGMSWNRHFAPPAPPVRSSCVDRVNPANGISDCPGRQYLCNDRTYFNLMTQECPATCQRCP